MYKNPIEYIIQLKYNNIREIYLFGSVARGDQDEKSDIDILIVIDDCSEESYVKCKKEYAKVLCVPVSWISLYRASKILKMHQRGSYFLWHIKKEGKKIYSRDNELTILLQTLPKYQDMKKDIKEYKQILGDIEEELQNENICIEYELSVLASLVRNTCITISYLNKKIDFSRNAVVEYCIDKYKLEISLKEYENLYQYRLFYTGKIHKVSEGTISDLKKWIRIENDLLKIAKGEEKTYEKTISTGME